MTMRRREFIARLGSVAAWPVVARAQQPALPVVGFLNSGSADGYAPMLAGFRQGLKESGYVEGQNVAVEYRWVEGQYDRVPAMAAELVRMMMMPRTKTTTMTPNQTTTSSRRSSENQTNRPRKSPIPPGATGSSHQVPYH
jgi:hypothetical protein